MSIYGTDGHINPYNPNTEFQLWLAHWLAHGGYID